MLSRIAAAVLAGLVLIAPVATAQTTVLVIDSSKALNDSQVGQDIIGKVRGIVDTMNAELQESGAPISEQFESFRAEVSALDASAIEGNADLQNRYRELAVQGQQWQVQERIKAIELQYSQNRALQPIAERMDEIIEQLVQERGADILLERGLVSFAGDQVDITAEVTSRLDAAVTSADVPRYVLQLDDAGQPVLDENGVPQFSEG